MLWKYREKECGLFMSWWKEFDSFKLIPHTEYIIPDCFLPLPGDFETKNYISVQLLDKLPNCPVIDQNAFLEIGPDLPVIDQKNMAGCQERHCACAMPTAFFSDSD